jgi:hypothetical protein
MVRPAHVFIYYACKNCSIATNHEQNIWVSEQGVKWVDIGWHSAFVLFATMKIERKRHFKIKRYGPSYAFTGAAAGNTLVGGSLPSPIPQITAKPITRL